MLVHLQVALGMNCQIPIGVSSQERQHMIKKADARGNLRPAAAIQIQLQTYLGFRRAAFDQGRACHAKNAFDRCLNDSMQILNWGLIEESGWLHRF